MATIAHRPPLVPEALIVQELAEHLFQFGLVTAMNR